MGKLDPRRPILPSSSQHSGCYKLFDQRVCIGVTETASDPSFELRRLEDQSLPVFRNQRSEYSLGDQQVFSVEAVQHAFQVTGKDLRCPTQSFISLKGDRAFLV